MKHTQILLALLALSVVARSMHGEEVAITAFEADGSLQWTTSTTGGTCAVECADALNGDWTTHPTFSDINCTSLFTSVHLQLTNSYGVYRIRWDYASEPTQYVIHGIVYYSTNRIAGHSVEMLDYDNPATVLQVTTADVSGYYSFAPVSTGKCYVGTTATGEYRGGYSLITVADSAVEQDIYLEKPMTVVFPTNGAAVATASPLVHWTALPESKYYGLALQLPYQYPVIERSGMPHELTTNRYQITTVCTNGVEYRVYVNSYDADFHVVGFAESTFTIALP